MAQLRLALVFGLGFVVAGCRSSAGGPGRIGGDDLAGVGQIQLDAPDLADPPLVGNPTGTDDMGLPAGCQAELCNNGIDDNCNGLIDDGCACSEGATQSCFSGPPAARGVGTCKDGTAVCQGGLEFVSWGACSGDVVPRAEECDSAGLDENCDGTINEGCECTPGVAQACGTDTGECTAGTQSCVNGFLEACAGSVGPMMEVCNGKDDDCDGMVDEGLAIACGTSTGACEPGTSACVNGLWLACEGATVAVTERCNNIDDDCDGKIDNGLELPCGTDTGECVAGKQICDKGAFGVCMGAVGPVAETCNNKDDDCDGMTDDMPSEACGIDTGACQKGVRSCSAGLWSACVGEVTPKTEGCNGVDDDCDGMTDEGCNCIDGTTSKCGTDTGECVAGNQTCVNGQWGACVGSVGPATETCNNKDDDCDGMIDDGVTQACGTDTGECAKGTQTCSAGTFGACVGGVVATTETCNNKDDNCDGMIDNGVTQACGTDTGECVKGTQTCAAGVWGTCAGSVGAVAETCNNKDDDCDGVVDDGVTQACGTDTGECVRGTQTCSAGMFGSCTGGVGPATETCDRKDNNCDGVVDEGCECRNNETQACGTDTGACVAGTQRCDATGHWGPCMNAVGPVAETCNNKDDDCDGATDEGLTQGCGSDTGECVAGTQTCSAGTFGACTGQIGPVTETCNNKDDDCDGTVDDGVTQACGIDTGECAKGTQTCSAGSFGACTGQIGPVTETCNNKDDDCDGMTDEGVTQACGTDTGECSKGTQTCSAGTFGACTGSIGPVTETCNNKDDDCDGAVDDSVTRPCGSDVGACVAGTQTCSAGSWATSCPGSIGPVTEICGNGIDDDCDGTADEVAQCPPATTPPVVMCPAGITTQPLQTVSLSGSGSDPDGGSVTYRWTVTTAPSGSSSAPASPNSASTTFFVDLAGHYQLTLTVTDNEGQTASCTVDITSVPPQQIHVELVWNTAWGDADLHFTQAGVDPATAWYMSSSIGEAACWYGNTTAAWPAGGAAGDATLDIDDRDGFGPENINILMSPATGTYEIGVAYYCSHSVPRTPGERVDPGDGPTAATVKVWCGGVLIATYPNINLSKTGQFVDVASVTWPACTGKSVMKSTWTALVQPAYYTAPVHCPIPCSGVNDCTSGEVCTAGLCRLD